MALLREFWKGESGEARPPNSLVVDATCCFGGIGDGESQTVAVQQSAADSSGRS